MPNLLIPGVSIRQIFLASAALLLSASITTEGHASTIGYVGADIDSTAGALRDTSVAKPLDLSGDNVYGTSGYAIAYSGANASVFTSAPSFVSSISTLAGLYLGGDNPNTLYQTLNIVPAFSASPTSQNSGLIYGTGASSNLMSFTLTTSATFRLGIIDDNTDNSVITPSSLTVTQTVGGAATASTSVTNHNLLTDYYFFDISGQAGDTFVISGATGGGGIFGIAGITFDVAPSTNVSTDVPEPASLAVLGAGVVGAFLARRRARRAKG